MQRAEKKEEENHRGGGAKIIETGGDQWGELK